MASSNADSAHRADRLWQSLVAASPAEAAQGRAAAELSRHLEALDREERSAFLDRLLELLLAREHRYDLALMALAGVEDPGALPVVARHLRPLPGPLDETEEAHLAELVRVVAIAPDTSRHRVVQDYLLDRPLATCWPTVAWAVWPRRRALFGRAWARYVRETGPERWAGPVMLEPFLAAPAAVREVLQRLEEAAPQRRSAWRDALRAAAAAAGWLPRDRREELERLLA